MRAGKKLSRDEQAAAFEACARRLQEWEELNGSVRRAEPWGTSWSAPREACQGSCARM